MRLLMVLLVIMLSLISVAQAEYINDSAFNLGNNIYITLMNTTFNNLTCCVLNTLYMNVSGSAISYTAGTNKTVTNPTYTLDNFTFSASGTAGYLNFSATMLNASNSYNLTANNVFIESRNTTVNKNVWFNYTGSYPAILTVSWNNTSPITSTINGSINITSYFNNINGWNQTTMNINAGNSATFNITANQTPTTVSWKVDGVEEQNTSSLEFTRAFNTLGNVNLTAQANNSNGSSQIVYTVVTVSEGGAPPPCCGGGGDDLDYAFGWVKYPNGTGVNGATVYTNAGNQNTNINGYYSFGYVFIHGNSYNFNITKTGHNWSNQSVSFAAGDYQIVNATIDVPTTYSSPNITSWSNDNTLDGSLTLTIPRNTNLTLNLSANQTATTLWTGGTAVPTKINGTDENFSYAYYNFTIAGVFTVIPSCSNSNGTCTNAPTWTITVTGLSGYNLTGYVQDTLELKLQNARVDFNNTYNFTDTNGYYQFNNITEGTYTILARAKGYSNSTITTTLNTNMVVNFTLSEPIYATKEDATNAGIMGIIGGVLAAILIIKVLKRRKHG